MIAPLDSTLVILNPVAGPNAQRVLERDRLARALRDAGLPGDWEETRPDRDADRIVQENDGEGPVVVIGGDGTAQAAARALIGGPRPLLVIPRGSGNVFAQRLGLSPRLGAALASLRNGRVRQVDVGDLDGEPFLLGVGMGIDARIIREADRKLKKQVGPLAYVVGAAKSLPVRHHDFEIEVDGRDIHERGASVMVANFGTLFGPFTFPPGADGTDGQLDVAILKAESLEQSLSLLGSPWLPREAAQKGVAVVRAREVRVRASEELPLQVDGEDLGDHREIECGILEERLSVIVPASRRE